MAMMFIGGASGSTAGGIKVNTFSVLLIAIVSTVRGLPHAEALGRRLPTEVIFRALSVALLSIAFIFVVALGLELTTPATISFIAVVFEVDLGVRHRRRVDRHHPGAAGPAAGPARSPRCSPAGSGPLTLVLALAARARRRPARPAVETMRIG